MTAKIYRGSVVVEDEALGRPAEGEEGEEGHDHHQADRHSERGTNDGVEPAQRAYLHVHTSSETRNKEKGKEKKEKKENKTKRQFGSKQKQ